MSEDRDQYKVAALKAWQQKLVRDYDGARREALEALERLSAAPFCKQELARFFSQMMNGVAVPSDFGRGKEGLFTIA